MLLYQILSMRQACADKPAELPLTLILIGTSPPLESVTRVLVGSLSDCRRSAQTTCPWYLGIAASVCGRTRAWPGFQPEASTKLLGVLGLVVGGVRNGTASSTLWGNRPMRPTGPVSHPIPLRSPGLRKRDLPLAAQPVCQQLGACGVEIP